MNFYSLVHKYRLLKNRKIFDKYKSSADDKLLYQLKAFNETWFLAIKKFLFYQKLQEKYKLPHQISNLSELNSFPIIGKEELIDYFDEYLKNNHTKVMSTGGSSGKPLNFPVSSDFAKKIFVSTFNARKLNGFDLEKRTILAWGHSHLFGSGLSKYYKKSKRYILDKFGGYKRFSAYDISDDNFYKIYKYMLSNDIHQIIGYSSFIKAFCEFCSLSSLKFKKPIKSIVTSEQLFESDNILIKNAFKDAPIIEYGLAESGALAYGNLDSNIMNTLWFTNILQVDNHNEAIITTLNNSGFPFIRYRTGDLIESKSKKESILHFQKVIGRSNDNIFYKKGQKIMKIHSEFFTHIIKTINGVKDFRLVQNKNLESTLYFQGSIDCNKLEKIVKEEITKNLKINIFQIKAIKSSRLELSKSGKVKFCMSHYKN